MPPRDPAEARRRGAILGGAGGAAAAATPPVAGTTAVSSGAGAAVIAAEGASAPARVLAKILDSLRKLLSRLRRYRRQRLEDELVRRATPQADIDTVLDAEEGRETIFQKRSDARVEKGARLALKVKRPEKQAAALQAVIDRERRYAEMRADAATIRVFHAAEREALRRTSPLGAYWTLGPARTHTPDCLAMAGKVWPWSVLDKLPLPLHTGCRCRLISIGDAQGQGLLEPGSMLSGREAEQLAAPVIAHFRRHDGRDFALEELSLREELAEAGADPLRLSLIPLLEDFELREAARPFYHWDPTQHPRDLLGRFIETLNGFDPWDMKKERTAHLDPTTRVSLDEDRTFRVVTGSQHFPGFSDPQDAARAAADASARRKEPGTIGGDRKLPGGFDEFLRKKGIDPDEPVALNAAGNANSEVAVQDELERLRGTEIEAKGNATALNNSDVAAWQKRAAERVTDSIRDRRLNYERKVERIGKPPRKIEPERVGALDIPKAGPKPVDVRADEGTPDAFSAVGGEATDLFGGRWVLTQSDTPVKMDLPDGDFNWLTEQVERIGLDPEFRKQMLQRWKDQGETTEGFAHQMSDENPDVPLTARIRKAIADRPLRIWPQNPGELDWKGPNEPGGDREFGTKLRDEIAVSAKSLEEANTWLKDRNAMLRRELTPERRPRTGPGFPLAPGDKIIRARGGFGGIEGVIEAVDPITREFKIKGHPWRSLGKGQDPDLLERRYIVKPGSGLGHRAADVIPEGEHPVERKVNDALRKAAGPVVVHRPEDGPDAARAQLAKDPDAVEDLGELVRAYLGSGAFEKGEDPDLGALQREKELLIQRREELVAQEPPSPERRARLTELFARSSKLNQEMRERRSAAEVERAEKLAEKLGEIRPGFGTGSARGKSSSPLAKLSRDSWKLVPKEWMEDTVLPSLRKSNGRGSYSRSRHRILSPEKPSTVIHEWAHYWQKHLSWLSEAEQRFHAKRTAGQSPVPLTKLFPRYGYRRSEVAIPDDFAHSYVGKVYGNKDSWEVLTMGLETVFYGYPGHPDDRDPLKDPGHVNFTLGMLAAL